MKTSETIKKSFPVLEMTCAACAVSVESMLKNTEGVVNANVNFANASATVEFSKDTPLENLQKSVRAIGYDLLIEEDDAEDKQAEYQRAHYEALKKRTWLSIILSLPVVIIGMFFMDMPYGNIISMLLSAPVVFYLGKSFFVNAFKQAKHGKANMDTLVALSTSIAFIFSLFNTFFPDYWHERGLHAHVYYEAAAVVIAFISLGKLLEERAKSNTSSAIKKLMGLQAKTVNIIKDGEEKTVSIKDVNVGDIIIIKPGEKIPVDGVVKDGLSFVDESMISGEPIAVEKKSGEKVFAGTINQKGSFNFIAEKVGADTVLSQIIKMVQEAQGSKAPVQKLVDKIAGIFVPIVILISIITFISWWIWGGENGFTYALLNAVTVLVIACPCALGLATPTAIMVGVGKGAEHNILIKDAESLELAHKVNVVVLDKTGTITEGRPEVSHAIWTEKSTTIDKKVLLSMESLSEHPLADAIVKVLSADNIEKVKLDKFNSITGRGVMAEYASEIYYIGNIELLKENNVNINPDILNKANNYQADANTVVWFANKQEVLSIYAISDKIKSSSRAAIENLQDRGIDVYMLTGDNVNTAEAVARKVGLKHYVSNVMPSQKADFIKELQSNGKVVAMVGDGINDSQALAQADVSIAMGKGSDIAMDVAKITLISSDLQSVPKALQLSKKTVLGIKQNLFWAFIYNIIGIPLAAGVLFPFNGFLLDPMIAGAAMALSSVSVVSNSLRLKSIKL